MSKMQIQIEDSYIAHDPAKMTDSGDHQLFSSVALSFSLTPSDENGIDRRPVVRPNGVRNGFQLIPAVAGVNDAIDVAAGSAYLAFKKTAIAAVTNLVIARPATLTHIVHSITINSVGAIVAVTGTEASAFSATRGTAGGAPLIPIDSIEIGTVSLSTATAAVITEGEVAYNPEFTHSPEFDILPYTGQVKFKSVIRNIHTGNVGRDIYIKSSEPTMVEITSNVSKVSEVKQPNAIDSIKTYGGLDTEIIEGDLVEGSLEFKAKSSTGSIFNRADGTVRKFSVMPDKTSDRKIHFYALVTNSAEFQAGAITVASSTLAGILAPWIETV